MLNAGWPNYDPNKKKDSCRRICYGGQETQQLGRVCGPGDIYAGERQFPYTVFSRNYPCVTYILLPCSSRINLAGMASRRCLLPTTRWVTFQRTTKERWTCMLRLSPRLWGWIWLDFFRPGAGPLKQPLRGNSPTCSPGVTTPWPSMTEL